MKTLLFLVLLAAPALAQSRFVTLTTGTNRPYDTLTIGTNETARIVCGGGENPYLHVSKEGFKAEFHGSNLFPPFSGSAQLEVRIAGPASFRFGGGLTGGGPNYSSFATIEIIPESFPADKTLIIPADTRGATVLMEASPDLIHWTNSAPGLFTNSPSHLFFRLRAERLP